MKKLLLSFYRLLLLAGFAQVPARLCFVRIGKTVPSLAAYTKGQLTGQGLSFANVTLPEPKNTNDRYDTYQSNLSQNLMLYNIGYARFQNYGPVVS